MIFIEMRSLLSTFTSIYKEPGVVTKYELSSRFNAPPLTPLFNLNGAVSEFLYTVKMNKYVIQCCHDVLTCL